jgi:hypothetical protein
MLALIGFFVAWFLLGPWVALAFFLVACVYSLELAALAAVVVLAVSLMFLLLIGIGVAIDKVRRK